MFEKIVKFLCIGVLVLAVAFRVEDGLRILLQLVICGGAAFVMMQAARNGRFLWMVAFGLIAIYFNPVVPIELSRNAERPLVFACLALFLASLRYLGNAPRMSLATITDLPARGESL